MGKKLRIAELKLKARGHTREYIRKPYRKKMDIHNVEHILLALINSVGINDVVTALFNVCCHGDAHALSKINLPEEQIGPFLEAVQNLRR